MPIVSSPKQMAFDGVGDDDAMTRDALPADRGLALST